MTAWAGFLRGVNVGKTGRIAMEDVRAACADAGVPGVKTYLAHGNLLFVSDLPETALIARLAPAMERVVGRPAGPILRTRDALAAALDAHPFQDANGARVVLLMLPDAVQDSDIRASGQTGEDLTVLGRDIAIYYPDGQGRSRLSLPAQQRGTARNLNTLRRIVEKLSAPP